jgi:3-hydroxyisobutyrate dehydrogenase
MENRVAFIGLGIMGAAMAGRLLDAGLQLTVHSRTRSKAEPLLAKGATWAATPADGAGAADVVFICVTDTQDVEAVIWDQNGINSVARPDLIVVDHSTISPAATRNLSASLALKGTTLLDAPVSGGDIGARNGTLSIMVGGDEKAFAKVQPLLAHMGKTITHCGPSGSGQLTKLVNQILVSVTNLAVCEALVFAKSNGLDLQKTLAAVGGGAGASWQLANLAPRMIAGDMAPGFMVDLQRKDLRLVREATEAAHISLLAVKIAAGLFASAHRDGHGRDGTQALFNAVDQCSKL